VEEKNSLLKTKERSDHRLKKNRQFSYIYKKGERVKTKNFNLFIIKSKFKTYKIGYSISKKEGKANKRNLLKRRIKEVVRLNNLPKEYNNYVLQARVGACDLTYQQIEKQLINLFSQQTEHENLKKNN
jgi:ribonuclease P protein component